MKTRIIASVGALFILLWLAPATARADQELLASAKLLYESASYEAALSELSAIDSKEDLNVIDTYRALCLLGLGRTRDAERALEVMVTRKPLVTLSENEYSPRIVALFRDVRKRALPVAVQHLYSTAKTDYENKNFAAAAAGFKEILQILSELDPKEQTATLADVKELASGFLTLAEVKLAEVKVAEVKIAQQAIPKAPQTSTAIVAAPVLYTLLDAGVTPPVAIDQLVPAWRFASNLPDRAFRGRLELVVGETGTVETVTLVEPIWPAYDAVLLQAAKRWRYQPAVRDGKPVKFRRVLDINIDPKMQPVR